MKKYIYIIVCVLAFQSCTNYLDKQPIGVMTDDNYWISETTVRLFANEFYNLFPGYGNGTGTGDFYFKTMDDNVLNSSGPSPLTNTIPTSSANWVFTYIRKANLLLSRIDQVPMSDEAKLHWKGVARLFRAWEYCNKVKLYGDIPWYDTYYKDDDPALYKPRDPRQLVMDNVLEDFKYAVANLKESDGANRINKDVARAMMARACLFEGTYRKYHGIADYQKFLNAAKDAALEIIKPSTSAPKYRLNTNYKTTYVSVELNGNQEMILYKKYLPGVLSHPTMGWLVSSTTINGLNKFAVESYLCTDGLPISLSPLYKGDATAKTVTTNRDKRLTATIDTVYCYADSPYQGTTSSSGYKVIKYVCDEMLGNDRLQPNNHFDAPLFWLAEVFLNYAEAKAELGTLTQDDVSMTINLLRNRAGVADLVLASLPNDPKRDADVPALLWEIRRERQVELMYDGFRQWDLYRWKKGDYLTTEITVDANDVITKTVNPDYLLGAKVPDNGKIKRNPDGYIMIKGKRTFLEKNYLEPIPSGQFPLYPPDVLKQNELWK